MGGIIAFLLVLAGIILLGWIAFLILRTLIGRIIVGGLLLLTIWIGLGPGNEDIAWVLTGLVTLGVFAPMTIVILVVSFIGGYFLVRDR